MKKTTKIKIWSAIISVLTSIAVFILGIVFSKRNKIAAVNNAAIKFANSTEDMVLKDYKKSVKEEVKKIKEMSKESIREEFKRRFM